METADVVIIGAGVSGCSIAAHLVQLEPGLSVCLLDQKHVGAGSSSRSTAAFRHQWSVPAHVSFSRYSSAEYDRLAGLAYPIQFRRNGYLFLFTDPNLLHLAAQRVSRQRDLGVEGVEVLSPEELNRRVSVGGLLDTESLVGATWGPSDGFLDPLAVAQAYLDEARKAGVRYRPDSPVTAIETSKDGSSVAGVGIGSSDSVLSSHIVNCAGIWSHAVAELAGLSLPISPAKRYLYHSHPVHDLDVSAWPMLIGDNSAHLRPSEGNTIMIAWEHRPEPLSQPPDAEVLWDHQDEIEPGFGTGPDGYGIEILGELSRHLPILAERVGLSRATCGWYAITPDHKAILGEDPRTQGLYHATGFSGHGVMHAAATGLTLAELILAREPTLASTEDLETHFGLASLLDGRLREPVEDMVL
jgi:sarcosine oxidase subunit beta